jgi:hypothetical protein
MASQSREKHYGHTTSEERLTIQSNLTRNPAFTPERQAMGKVTSQSNWQFDYL